MKLHSTLVQIDSLHEVRNLLPVIHSLLEFHIALGDQHIHHRQLFHVSVPFKLLPDLGPHRGDGNFEDIDFDNLRHLSPSNPNKLRACTRATKN